MICNTSALAKSTTAVWNVPIIEPTISVDNDALLSRPKHKVMLFVTNPSKWKIQRIMPKLWCFIQEKNHV